MQFQKTRGVFPLLGVLLFTLGSALQAQHGKPETDETHNILAHELPNTQGDLHGGLHSLQEFFGLGTIRGHLRNYFMTTISEGGLKDYYANAIGGSMGFYSHEFYGFHVGAAGIFTFKAFSNDLNEADPIAGRASKWERELFDVLDPENFSDLDRLEALYINYTFSIGQITFGKMIIEETPFMNRSDGRMKPFAFKGFWGTLTPWKDHRFNLSWIDRISPRSTVEWFDFNEGIGLAYQGFQPNGQEADYHEHLETDGVGMLSYQFWYNDWHLDLYQYYIHHLSFNSWVSLEYHLGNWDLGVQYALQFPDGFQSELPYEQRYTQPGERGQVISGQASYHLKDWSFRAAYTHAFDSGRFLFPRELGRDHFYTSIARSRLEGFGNADVFTLGGEYYFLDHRLIARLEATQVNGPRVDSFEFNKYNLDEYRQVNLQLNYHFKGFLEGLDMTLFYVYRKNQNNSDPEVVFNLSNYHQINFVTNFEF